MIDLETIRKKYPGAEAFKFGDSEELSSSLVALVREGKKRATCGALRDFEEGGEAKPVVGRRDVVLDWNDVPQLVIETVSVEITEFQQIGEDFALAEGENETLEGWRRDHKAYFVRNGGFSEDMQLICERFEVVEDLQENQRGEV